ncbi:DMT family transporter [Williamsia sp. SKLECPSW1]
MHTWIPAVLAIGAAALIALGTVLRQRASCAGGAITVMWSIGAAVALLGFGLQAGALGLGSILLVQPIVVLAVLFALPMEAVLDHRRPTWTEWGWGGVLVVCVGLFLLLADPQEVERRPDHLLIAGTVLAAIALLVGLVVVAEKADDHHRALCYGLVAGTLFGIGALLIKAVVYQVLHDPLHLWSRPEAYLFAVVAVGGIVAQQRSFVAGELQTSFPAMTVMEPAVSMALGVTLLGESVRVGWWQNGLMVVALAVMVVAVVVLARISAIRGTGDATTSAGPVTSSGIHSTVGS